MKLPAISKNEQGMKNITDRLMMMCIEEYV